MLELEGRNDYGPEKYAFGPWESFTSANAPPKAIYEGSQLSHNEPLFSGENTHYDTLLPSSEVRRETSAPAGSTLCGMVDYLDMSNFDTLLPSGEVRRETSAPAGLNLHYDISNFNATFLGDFECPFSNSFLTSETSFGNSDWTSHLSDLNELVSAQSLNTLQRTSTTSSPSENAYFALTDLNVHTIDSDADSAEKHATHDTNSFQQPTSSVISTNCSTSAPAPSPRPRRFQCTANGCRKSYKRYYDLLRHRRKHSGVKAHACHFARCNRSGGNGFERRDHLAQHLRQVHGV